jgi:pimeloyl-[acyl-carrier protein] methyl ester esterase
MNYLLLRGLGRVKEHWLDFPERLKKHSPSTGHIACPDLPGFGSEQNAKIPLTIAGHVDYVREKFLAEHSQDLAEPWCLVGLSLGGMLALDWAARFTTDFKKLVVINTSARDVSPWTHRLSPFSLYTGVRIASAKNAKERERASLKLIANLKDNDPEILRAMLDIAEKHGNIRARVWQQLAAAALFTCPMRVGIPTLVISSLKDRMVDSRCSKAIAERLSTEAAATTPVQIKFHATAGHDIPLDDPEWLVTRLVEFAEG